MPVFLFGRIRSLFTTRGEMEEKKVLEGDVTELGGIKPPLGFWKRGTVEGIVEEGKMMLSRS